jgi:hypothetical protein
MFKNEARRLQRKRTETCTHLKKTYDTLAASSLLTSAKKFVGVPKECLKIFRWKRETDH